MTSVTLNPQSRGRQIGRSRAPTVAQPAIPRLIAKSPPRCAYRRQSVTWTLSRSAAEESPICAYGTGVWVMPVSDVAKQQYDALVAAGQLPQQDTYQLRISELQRTETIPGVPPR